MLKVNNCNFRTHLMTSWTIQAYCFNDKVNIFFIKQHLKTVTHNRESMNFDYIIFYLYLSVLFCRIYTVKNAIFNYNNLNIVNIFINVLLLFNRMYVLENLDEILCYHIIPKSLENISIIFFTVYYYNSSTYHIKKLSDKFLWKNEIVWPQIILY